MAAVHRPALRLGLRGLLLVIVHGRFIGRLLAVIPIVKFGCLAVFRVAMGLGLEAVGV